MRGHVMRRVEEMTTAGLSVAEMAERLDRSPNAITAAQFRLRRRKKTELVRVPIDVLHGLRAAARDRGVSAGELASRVLSAVTEDDMFNAVLDDPA